MPKNSVRKNRSIIIACVMLFVVILTGSILLFSRTQEEGMYFLTFESRRADKYVEEHIGEFLDSESGINPIDRDTVKVGAGIYVEDFDETTSLPMFYYSVFTDESLSYVFRIYEDINGEYTSVFGIERVDAIVQLALDTPKNAVFFGQNHGNLIAIYSNFDYEVIEPSRFGESVNEEEIKAFQKQERETLSPVNICSKEIDFIKYPVSKAYY